jgi:hypothetical protein
VRDWLAVVSILATIVGLLLAAYLLAGLLGLLIV